jgi:hypothetical protein
VVERGRLLPRGQLGRWRPGGRGPAPPHLAPALHGHGRDDTLPLLLGRAGEPRPAGRPCPLAVQHIRGHQRARGRAEGLAAGHASCARRGGCAWRGPVGDNVRRRAGCHGRTSHEGYCDGRELLLRARRRGRQPTWDGGLALSRRGHARQRVQPEAVRRHRWHRYCGSERRVGSARLAWCWPGGVPGRSWCSLAPLPG